jgi:hypothetical protein
VRLVVISIKLLVAADTSFRQQALPKGFRCGSSFNSIPRVIANVIIFFVSCGDVVFMSMKLHEDPRTVRTSKCIYFRTRGDEEGGVRGHALPLVYL